jgi:hypothetical protein
MASYHIWHPAYVHAEPLVLEAFITLGDSIFLSQGTATFVQAVLNALGLVIQPLSWQLQPVRTHYFNSYREDSGNWEDAWDLVWRLRMTLRPESPPALPDPPGWGYFDLNAADGSFRPESEPRQWRGWNCLLLADAADVSIIETVKSIVGSAQPQAVCEWGKAFGRLHELRCDLGYYPRSFYERGAPEAEALLPKFIQAGAAVRFNTRRERELKA